MDSAIERSGANHVERDIGITAIALIQALVVTFFLAGTVSGNGIVVLGVGQICLIFMEIVLISAIKAVCSAFNRLFNAFGQATGGAVISPGTAAAATDAAGIGAVGLPPNRRRSRSSGWICRSSA